jgi:thiol-disulfide isomerase/thioredoxin
MIEETINTIKDFFNSKFNIALVLMLLLLGGFLFLSEEQQQISPSDKLTVFYFYTDGCPYCAQQKPIILELQKELPEIEFILMNAGTSNGSKLFYEMSEKAGLDTSRLGVPATFIGEKPLIGLHSKEKLLEAIIYCEENCAKESPSTTDLHEPTERSTEMDLPFIGETDLMNFSLPVLAVILGLLDGFNPCALWVLIFLISVLITLNDRKKMILIAGSFIFAPGVLYFLFMTAWLNVFLLIGYVRIITILIGLTALGGGIIGIKNYLTPKPLTCNVGNAKSKKKIMTRIESLVSKPISITLLIGVIALAFVVNSVEFLCSAAIPAVFTQILALSKISMIEQYAYIILYLFFFLIDQLLIFSLAIFAVNTSIGQKYAKYCKGIGGLILFILGFMLLFFPNLLM